MAYYLKDQLSINTRKLLADFMAQLIIIADSVQSFRLALAATPFFNGIQLFRFLDQDQKGYLTPKDFARLVSDDSKKLLHYAFGWFDVSKVGQITKTQFLQFVFPHSNPELRQLITARMLEQQLPEQKASSLPEQTDLLRCLILQIMQRETRLIPMRRILMDQEDYTIKAVMNCLDVEARGWVTTGDIYKFLKNYDVEVTMGKVCGIVGVYDCDMNGKINMREMQILVQGLENSQSQYRKIVRNSDKCAKTKMRNERCSCYKKYGYKSAQKLRSTSMKKQMKIQTAKKTNKQNQQQKRRSEFADKIVSTKLGIQLKDEKDRKSQKNRHNIKVERQRQKKVDKQKSNKKQRIQKSDRKQKIQNKSLEELRLAFQALEKQTQFIDEDLKKIEEQMGARTEMEMQRQLESAHIKKRLKLQQQEMLRRKIEEIEIVREQERIRRIKEEETARIVQMENRRALQLQIQRNRALQRQNQNFRIAQEQRIRELEYQNLRLKQQQQMRNRELQHIRMMQREKNRLQELQFEKLQHIELQKIKEVESQRLATLELRKIKQIQASRLKELEIKRLSQIHMKRQIGEQLDKIQQIQIQNAIRRSRIEQQAYDREIIASYEAEAKKLSHSQYDWYAEAKIKALHQEQVRERLSMQGISQKESQYFWRYRNYCENLASIGDPLGIKQHLAQTDKYLIKSKSIRDQIKRDRTYSLNRYTNLYKSKTKSRTNTQNQELITETPDQKHKDIIDTINKRTEQTKLAWSNN